MADYVIADLHLFDKAILTYENRPFKTIEEYNSKLIKEWNKTVSREDTVYILGDVGPVGEINEDDLANVIEQLNGRKVLVLGNHDREYLYTDDDWRALGFNKVYELPVVYNGFIILSHEPMYVSKQSPFKNIYGHVHGNPNYKDVSSAGACVCVERIGYKPIALDEIMRLIRKEQEN